MIFTIYINFENIIFMYFRFLNDNKLINNKILMIKYVFITTNWIAILYYYTHNHKHKNIVIFRNCTKHLIETGIYWFKIYKFSNKQVSFNFSPLFNYKYYFIMVLISLVGISVLPSHLLFNYHLSVYFLFQPST